MGAGIGAVAAIGDQFDLGAAGVVAQSRFGDGRPCGVASDAQQGVTILDREYETGGYMDYDLDGSLSPRFIPGATRNALAQVRVEW